MEQCPCGTGKTYSSCCEKYINKKEIPQTAELLMRSRYTAYVKKEVPYIIQTIMPAQLKEIDEEGIRKWAEKTSWQNLQIVNTEKGGPDDKKGTVEFIAQYKEKGVVCNHHEIGRFSKHDGSWFYEDSEFPAQKQFVRSDTKVKRNDPCPCGSGKKYKKCCGK